MLLNFFSNSILLPWVRVFIFRRDFTLLKISSASFIYSTLKTLKLSSFFQYTALLDIVAVDYPSKKNRFELTYILLSYFGFRVGVRTTLQNNEGLATVTSLYSSSAWLEREVWDMFGIIFFGNVDLRRILTDYGFRGHPLRKDFPLTGYLEIRYNDETESIIYESINLTQELRIFKFSNPYTHERWRHS